MERFNRIKMYPTATYHSVDDFKPHEAGRSNDIQILYNGKLNSTTVGHAVCIYYQGYNQKVNVYDSIMSELDPTYHNIIARLYPFNQGVEVINSKTLQGKSETCALFAICYATMLLLGRDPTKQEIRLNTVHGEEGLYMRIYILNMFANRRLALMN